MTTNQIYEDIAKEGAIVPVPLIILAAAISFPFVIVGCLGDYEGIYQKINSNHKQERSIGC